MTLWDKIKQKVILPVALLATTTFGATAFNPKGYTGVVGWHQNNNPINGVEVTSNLVLDGKTKGEWGLGGNVTFDFMRHAVNMPDFVRFWGLQYTIDVDVQGKIGNETYENKVAVKLETAMRAPIASIIANGSYNLYGDRITGAGIIELGGPVGSFALIIGGGIGVTNRNEARMVPIYRGTIALMPQREESILKELSVDFRRELDPQEAKEIYNTLIRGTFGFDYNEVSVALGSKTLGWQRFYGELAVRTFRDPIQAGLKLFMYGPSENEDPNKVRIGLGVSIGGIDNAIKSIQ